ncbi:malonyl-ACP O-methyltransferase BioC [Algivirga pacifica]|uniref:Malonyl-[acyl-carrier protein] O-methyltransferase n=1 Tax=Algivirga pacifica TaxID=1162670 RepID=A0ABP9DHA0_9BACT
MITQHINKPLVAQKFEASMKTYVKEASVQQNIAHTLFRLLDKVPFTSERILEIGCGTGFLSKKISTLPYRTLYLNDLVPAAVSYCQHIYQDALPLPGDIEQEVTLPEHLDLILSSSALQWIEDLPTFLQKIHTQLKTGGTFAFSTFGPMNMQEIKTLTGKGLHYWDMEGLTALLETEFEICLAQEEILSKTFSNPIEVLKHIKKTGVGGTANERWGKQDLLHFQEEYNRQFKNKNQEVILTYHPIYIIVKKK